MHSRNLSVLILTNSFDSHAHHIVKVIGKIGGKVIRIDTDRLTKFYSISLNIHNSNASSVTLETPIGKYTTDDISSIWIRRPYNLFINEKRLQDRLIKQDTVDFLKSLPYFWENGRFLILDKPMNVAFASKKIFQLEVAKRHGITIPKSVVTNNPIEAKDFLEAINYRAIVKPIARQSVTDGKKFLTVYTTGISQKDNLRLIRNCPTLIQEKVIKKTELRITVIGKKVFPIEYDSQNIPDAQTDIKKAKFEDYINTPHRLIEIPMKLEMALLKMLEYYGLNFGAFDFARTPDDDYVFFELNPAGQFLWLEELTGIPLAEEMAKFLIKGKQ